MANMITVHLKTAITPEWFLFYFYLTVTQILTNRLTNSGVKSMAVGEGNLLGTQTHGQRLSCIGSYNLIRRANLI